jgi:hypothetical protein
MSGRPSNKARERAIVCGETTYIGTPHSKCGTSERYVAGSACVYCARVVATEQREALKLKQHQARVDASDTNDAEGPPPADDEMFGDDPPEEVEAGVKHWEAPPVKEQSALVKDLLSKLPKPGEKKAVPVSAAPQSALVRDLLSKLPNTAVIGPGETVLDKAATKVIQAQTRHTDDEDSRPYAPRGTKIL